MSRGVAAFSVVARGYGKCRQCTLIYQRLHLGNKPQNPQVANAPFTFTGCGCSGVLPDRGVSNEFVIWLSKGKNYWTCRVWNVFRCSRDAARLGGYFPIDPDTPHAVIRQMMDEPLCYHCQDPEKPLDWTNLGRGKTPHLDHDHLIQHSNVNGFSHAKCNPQATRNRIEKLLAENAQLKAELEEYRQAEPLVLRRAA